MKCQFWTVICSNLEQILIQIDVDSTYHNLFMKQFIIYNWRRFSVELFQYLANEHPLWKTFILIWLIRSAEHEFNKSFYFE